RGGSGARHCGTAAFRSRCRDRLGHCRSRGRAADRNAPAPRRATDRGRRHRPAPSLARRGIPRPHRPRRRTCDPGRRADVARCRLARGGPMVTRADATDRVSAFGGASQLAGAGFLTTTGQTAKRTLFQFVRTPQLLVMTPIVNALFLIIFRYVFGGAINPGGDLDYVDFLIPGFLVQVFLWNEMNIPAGIVEDSTSGVYDRLRSLPIPRVGVVAGRSLADTLLNIGSLAVTVGLGFAVGFRTDVGAGPVIAALAVIVAAIYAFSWFFIFLGLIAGNAQAATSIATLVVVPLVFLSGA